MPWRPEVFLSPGISCKPGFSCEPGLMPTVLLMSENGEFCTRSGVRINAMKLDAERCYQALVSRDRRFDGAFFVGVRTTKIYCRPVCTARTPKKESCLFYSSHAAAEREGFRPCMRCRPELAPGNARVDAISRLAQICAMRIEEGALTEMSVDELADEMGVTGRHLRRVIETEYGVSPLDLAQTHRLLLAKRLLTDTSLPVTEVAFASGFSSLRRFNTLFKERYLLNPSQLRSGARTEKKRDYLPCELSYAPPFDWQSLIDFFSARLWSGIEGIERRADGSTVYMRTARMGKSIGWFSVEPVGERNIVLVKVSTGLAPHLTQILARVKRQFDLSVNPCQVEKRLGAIAKARPGLRVPGSFDGLEVAVRGILGQQISVKAATTLAGRFAQAFGENVETPYPHLNKLFPSAAQIAALEAEQLLQIGIIKSRAETIISLAGAVAGGELVLKPGVDVERGMERLKRIKGIGEWTAQYIAMRVFAWPDAYPHSDLGLKKALLVDDFKQVLELAEKWRPWRAYAAMHLWKSMERRNDELVYVCADTGGARPADV